MSVRIQKIAQWSQYSNKKSNYMSNKGHTNCTTKIITIIHNKV